MNAIRAALLELVASFPVYRSYVTPDATSATKTGRTSIGPCAPRAQNYESRDEDNSRSHPRLLLFELPDDAEDTYRRRAAAFTAMHFQQFTSPVMAKGARGHCFYRYVRLSR